MNKNFKNIFKEKGYFVIKNVITNDFVNKILSEIEIIKDADFYYDENDKLRRIERLYNKGENLKKLNKIIIDNLYDIFNDNYLIFKDKFNAKPPGGKGFFHTLMVYLNLKMKITKLGKVGMSMEIYLSMF